MEKQPSTIANAIMISGRLVVQDCPFCAGCHVHPPKEGLYVAPGSGSDRRLEYLLKRCDGQSQELPVPIERSSPRTGSGVQRHKGTGSKNNWITGALIAITAILKMTAA